jgi:hypothetical protein
VWDAITGEAAEESPLWRDALLPRHERQLLPVFSPLCSASHALGLETVYEGYLVHYGRPRLFAPPDSDTALLLGDYLYAHGLVRIAESGDVAAVADLAELIALCAQSRAAARNGGGDAAAWAATAALLGAGGLEAGRDDLRVQGSGSELERVARAAAGNAEVARAFAAHARLVG